MLEGVDHQRAKPCAGMHVTSASGRRAALGFWQKPCDTQDSHLLTRVWPTAREWSLFSRACENDLVPVCRELGIGFLAYRYASPLMPGTF